MERPWVFVSFSGKDPLFMRHFLARLEAQPVSVWNYADELQEIPAGESLPEYLMRQIDLADAFLPVVTPNSLGSEYVVLEVEYALKRRRKAPLRVIPIVATNADPPSKWGPPYRGLADLCHLQVDMTSWSSLEKALVDLCRNLGVRYLPLPIEDPRLPFMDKFLEEVKDVCSRHPDHERAVYSRLMLVLDEFVKAFRAGDFQKALGRIYYVIYCSAYEFPDEKQVYYPCIVKGICEIACGQLTRAAETLNGLLEHPRRDENVYGAMGYVCHHQGRYSEALDYYRQALALCPKDPAAKAGVLLNALLCDKPVDVEGYARQIDLGAIADAGDRIKLRALLAFALAKTGRAEEADREFEALLHEGAITADILVNCARNLKQKKEPARARDLLARFPEHFCDDNLLHLLASLCCQVGDLEASLRHFQTLLERCPHVRQYRIDMAQVLWHADRREEAVQVCMPMLDRVRFPLPHTPADFYCDGFANYLLRHFERAEYDFQRSGCAPDQHYRHLLDGAGPDGGAT